MREQYDFEIETVGFEIHPDTSLKGVELEKIFPGYKQNIKKLVEYGKTADVKFGNIEKLHNTHRALLIGEKAKEKGLSNEFADVMYKAYFLDCVDINDDTVLYELGHKIKLNDEEIKEALTNSKYEDMLKENNVLGRQYDIRSVPTFIINDQYKVVGSGSQDEIAKVFDKILGES